ncbi:hypothetical protein JZO70_10855 [Enterococcus sp. 669A]|uniref:DUF2975 domain-containing protein n=1 Tax=Candidatus Enterococcus moelleringii TaxID=2815325 RepID=A0ABS3LE59_9ENTE|nr:DUF2975 domain-containing protein [Enterococcus sp. 669A]MBO1306664.1 hypothetical protein [Enterococcus sp. 669A]
MKKYERFILGVLAFCCFTLQVLFVLASIILVIMAFPADSRQEMFKIVSEGMVLKNSMLSVTTASVYLFAVSVVQSILMFGYLNCIRNLLQNLNDEIYFEERNLQLIKKVLIFYGASAVIEALVAGFNKINHITLLTATSPSALVYLFEGFLVVMGIYVIYMVFKHGVRLKKESDAFI